MEEVWAVVVAGGAGSRFGGPKQFAPLAGKRVIDWSFDAARSVADGVVVVIAAPGIIAEAPGTDVPGADVVVAGGATRSASVRAGLGAVPDTATIVLVHDAARPAASAELFTRVVDAVRAGAAGAVPGVPVTDALRSSNGAVDRTGVVAVQTPQGFRADALRAAHASGRDAADDATLVELDGGTIVVVEGETTNLKLTYAHDATVLGEVLAGRERQP